jgi:hypothetical protein
MKAQSRGGRPSREGGRMFHVKHARPGAGMPGAFLGSY